MPGDDKRVAYAQLERGIRAIDKTLDLLDSMLLKIDAETQRLKIFGCMAELNARRRALDSLVAGFGRSDVSVMPPREYDYLALDQAMRLIDAVSHAPDGNLHSGLHLANTVSDALKATWENITHRSTL